MTTNHPNHINAAELSAEDYARVRAAAVMGRLTTELDRMAARSKAPESPDAQRMTPQQYQAAKRDLIRNTRKTQK